jgi:hypothetical protein
LPLSVAPPPSGIAFISPLAFGSASSVASVGQPGTAIVGFRIQQILYFWVFLVGGEMVRPGEALSMSRGGGVGPPVVSAQIPAPAVKKR